MNGQRLPSQDANGPFAKSEAIPQFQARNLHASTIGSLCGRAEDKVSVWSGLGTPVSMHFAQGTVARNVETRGSANAIIDGEVSRNLCGGGAGWLCIFAAKICGEHIHFH